MSTNSTHAANQFLYKRLPYDAQKDFAQVGMLGTFGTVGIVAPDSPYRTVPELVEYARNHPGEVFFGYYSSSSQVPSELFKATRRHQHRRRRLQEHHPDHHRPARQADRLRLRRLPDCHGPDRRQGPHPPGRHRRQRHPAWPDVPTMSTYYPTSSSPAGSASPPPPAPRPTSSPR
nr:tripartite tricarboxylate transporter substrate-binding protein [Achromobacter xylosoxidans]